MFLVLLLTRRRRVDLGGGIRYLAPARWRVWNAWPTEAQALDESYHLRSGGDVVRVVAEEDYPEFRTLHRVR